MATFTVRKTSPAGENLIYYNTISAGGINTSIVGNGAVAGANVLENCVGFCQGRALEVYYSITPNASGNPFSMFNVDAENWYNVAVANGFNVGSTPQVGAIGCYAERFGQTTTQGHVCFIEQYKNNQWEISESHYNYPFGQGSWDYSYLDSELKPAFISGNRRWRLLGFIYPFTEPLTPVEPSEHKAGAFAGVIGQRHFKKRKGRLILL